MWAQESGYQNPTWVSQHQNVHLEIQMKVHLEATLKVMTIMYLEKHLELHLVRRCWSLLALHSAAEDTMRVGVEVATISGRTMRMKTAGVRDRLAMTQVYRTKTYKLVRSSKKAHSSAL